MQVVEELSLKNDLDKVREFKRKNRIPQTLIVFKCFGARTPSELCKKLFGAYSNELPFDFFNVQTRVDYDYSGHRVKSEECLVFYVFTSL